MNGPLFRRLPRAAPAASLLLLLGCGESRRHATWIETAELVPATPSTRPIARLPGPARGRDPATTRPHLRVRLVLGQESGPAIRPVALASFCAPSPPDTGVSFTRHDLHEAAEAAPAPGSATPPPRAFLLHLDPEAPRWMFRAVIDDDPDAQPRLVSLPADLCLSVLDLTRASGKKVAEFVLPYSVIAAALARAGLPHAPIAPPTDRP